MTGASMRGSFHTSRVHVRVPVSALEWHVPHGYADEAGPRADRIGAARGPRVIVVTRRRAPRTRPRLRPRRCRRRRRHRRRRRTGPRRDRRGPGSTAMYGVPSASSWSARRGLALQQRDGGLDGGVSLELERLVDRGGLLAEKHVLQTGDRRVLTRDRNNQAVLVEDRDDAGGVGVVGGPHRVDHATERGQSLLEVGRRTCRRPRFPAARRRA